jgi:hypothetical protein
MTQLLKDAIKQVEKLTTEEQNAIAAMILDELEDDRKWDEAFARSQNRLAQLADKVRADIDEGRVRNLGIDEL